MKKQERFAIFIGGDLGIEATSLINCLNDLEEKGYLFHPKSRLYLTFNRTNIHLKYSLKKK